MNDVPRAERELLHAAERRLGLLILGLTPLGAAGVAWRWGLAMGAAFAVGGVLAYLNYRWIVSMVNTLMQAQQQGRVPRRAYAKLFLPLILLAGLLYVMFSRSLLPVVGVLAGLFLLVLVVMVEAIYEVAVAFRQ